MAFTKTIFSDRLISRSGRYTLGITIEINGSIITTKMHINNIMIGEFTTYGPADMYNDEIQIIKSDRTKLSGVRDKMLKLGETIDAFFQE